MSTFALILIAISLIIAVAVYRIGVGADWHWGGALAAATVPVAFTYFLGIIGIVIGCVFLGAIWRATNL